MHLCRIFMHFSFHQVKLLTYLQRGLCKMVEVGHYLHWRHPHPDLTDKWNRDRLQEISVSDVDSRISWATHQSILCLKIPYSWRTWTLSNISAFFHVFINISWLSPHFLCITFTSKTFTVCMLVCLPLHDHMILHLILLQQLLVRWHLSWRLQAG